MKVNYDQIMPARSPRQDELEINPITLSFSGDLNHIISCGSDGFIQKPFDIQGLSQKIREVLEQNTIAMNHSSDVSQALPV